MAIFLYTDFGSADLYVGQVKAVLAREAPGVPVIDLASDLPAFAVEPAAHLLDALVPQIPEGSVTLAVVDPGVGGARAAVVVAADSRWFVGPDNGLLSVVAARARDRASWRIGWRPPGLSSSFHGRDLFAPVAAAIARDAFPADRVEPAAGLAVTLAAADLPRIIYVDHYGNCLTGLRAGAIPREARLAVAGRSLAFARVFSDVSPGEAFWYENSLGLVELAANGASAAAQLGLEVGDPVGIG